MLTNREVITKNPSEGSTVLRLMIAALLTAGTFASIEDAFAQSSYCDLNGCVVVGDPGDGSGLGGGGWGGGATSTSQPPPPEPPSCEVLAVTKPESCPNPIPYPWDYDYAAADFPGGSGLAKILYFVHHQTGISPQAHGWIVDGLTFQTRAFASTSAQLSYDDIAKISIDRFIQGCKAQHAYDSASMLLGQMSVAEKACYTAVSTVAAEVNGQYNFLESLIVWGNQNGIDWTDIPMVPNTLINWLSPVNSMRIKFEKVDKDARCSTWWNYAIEQQCPVGAP